jgi:hypothetical protein
LPVFTGSRGGATRRRAACEEIAVLLFYGGAERGSLTE